MTSLPPLHPSTGRSTLGVPHWAFHLGLVTPTLRISGPCARWMGKTGTLLLRALGPPMVSDRLKATIEACHRHTSYITHNPMHSSSRPKLLLHPPVLSTDQSTPQCTRELLQAYYVKLAQTHSSGLYVVLDAGPRPTKIDTLPSHLIEWTVPPPQNEPESSGTVRQDKTSSSSESEPEEPQRRRIQAAPRSVTGRGSTHSTHSTHTTHRSPAVLPLPPPPSALSASRSVPTSPPTSFGRPPRGFRSPMIIGRRRRRPSLIDPTSPATATATAGAGAGAEIGPEYGYDVDVTALEGALRGGSRRRIEIDEGREREPGTPV